MSLFRMTVDAIVCHLPFLGEDDVVLLDGILDDVGHSQHLLLILLGIRLDLTNLGCMGSPLPFSIVHLKEIELVGYQEAYYLFSYLGFQLHYPG